MFFLSLFIPFLFIADNPDGGGVLAVPGVETVKNPPPSPLSGHGVPGWLAAVLCFR